MSKLKGLLGFLVSLIILLLILWGGTALISYIFKIEDSGTKTIIRWSLIAFIFILGAIIRRKFPSTR